jgi:hypothetical protein
MAAPESMLQTIVCGVKPFRKAMIRILISAIVALSVLGAIAGCSGAEEIPESNTSVKTAPDNKAPADADMGTMGATPQPPPKGPDGGPH